MKSSERNLLLKIARNAEPQKVFDMLKKGKDIDSPYLEIVNEQLKLGIKEMHLPEPWNGHLSKAQIMIISSNPSISAEEEFPTKKWSDDEIVDFFDNRFSGECWNVRTWTSFAKYISWVIKDAEGLDAFEVFNKYAVLTEIVHCKSRSEEGVENCISEECKFLDEIISNFSGKYIIIIGKQAKDFYDQVFFEIKDNSKKIAFMVHPTFPQSDEERKRLLLTQLKIKDA